MGVIDDGVINLMKRLDLRGMKVLLFAFNGDKNNPYLPENVDEKSVSYIGTHDNDTAVGYINKLGKDEKKRFIKAVAGYAGVKASSLDSAKKIADALLKILYSLKSEIVISSFADVNALGNKYRINEPSTMGNWTVRFPKKYFTDETAAKLALLADSRK